MAKSRMVTRTIQTTLATILCVNTETESTYNENVKLSGVFKDDKHILKAAEKFFAGSTIKPVHVVNAVINEDLYGMSEEQFLDLAKVLPARNPATATAVNPE